MSETRSDNVRVPIESISFWLNAFIPRDIAGYTAILRKGPYKGLTVLTGSTCCLTDQRNFSNDIRAASRMHSAFRVDSSDPPVLTQSHRCDAAIECDIEDGEVVREQEASTLDMKFVLTAVEPSIAIRMDCRAANPCAPAAPFGDIEYKGTIEINAAERSIAIDIMICLFPAFEAYAAINDGAAAILFRHAPPAGILALRLPPGANRRIRCQFQG